MIGVRDAVDGVYRVLTEPAALGRTFNIAGPRPTSYDEGAMALLEAYGVPVVSVEMPLDGRLEMTIDAREAIGFEPRFDCRSMVAAARNAAVAESEAYIPARI